MLKLLYFLVCVDDMIVAKHEKRILKEKIVTMFEMKDTGNKSTSLV